MFWVSVLIIADFFLFCKAVILQIFVPLLLHDSGGDLPQRHFRNITGGSAQNGDRFWRVKIDDIGKIVLRKMLPCVDAAARHQHICDAVFKQVFQPFLRVEVIQFFQQAAVFDFAKVGIVITEIVLCKHLSRLQEAGG